MRFAFVLLGVFISSVFVGCAAEDPSAPPVELSVERVDSNGGFIATWTFDKPVRTLAFTRSAGFRTGNWIGQNGVRIETRGAKEVMISNLPAEVFKVYIPDTETRVSGDYPFMVRYSDSGRLMYSGYLLATPTSCFANCTDEEAAFFERSPSRTRLTVTAAPSQQIVSGAGDVSTSSQMELVRSGGLIYFGKQTPVAAKGFQILSDRKAPSWIVKDLKRVFPDLVSIGSEKLGFPLAIKPLIFIPHGSIFNPESSKASQGALVGNQMLLNFSGSAWPTQSSALRESFFKLVAHETFHFWNGYVFESSLGAGGEWLHEGAAEAFSHLALAELGYISRESLRAHEEEALNRCILGSLQVGVSGGRGAEVRTPYYCGSVIHEIMGASLKLQGDSLWGFWRRIFTRASANHGKYSDGDFFAEAGELATPLSTLSRGPSGEVETRETGLENYYENLYRSVGREVVASDRDWPAWYSRFAAEKILIRALAADCGASGTTTSREDGQLRMGAHSGCRVLTQDVQIDYVGPHRLWSDGVAAYDYVVETCRASDTFKVRVVRDNSRVRVFCPDTPKRPRYLRLL